MQYIVFLFKNFKLLPGLLDARPTSSLDKLVSPQSMWGEIFLKNESHWLSSLGDPEEYYHPVGEFISRTFCHTMTTLIDRIKLQTVARHQNDKVRVSPSLIFKSGKRRANSACLCRDAARLCRSLKALVDYMGLHEDVVKEKKDWHVFISCCVPVVQMSVLKPYTCSVFRYTLSLLLPLLPTIPWAVHILKLRVKGMCTLTQSSHWSIWLKVIPFFIYYSIQPQHQAQDGTH